MMRSSHTCGRFRRLSLPLFGVDYNHRYNTTTTTIRTTTITNMNTNSHKHKCTDVASPTTGTTPPVTGEALAHTITPEFLFGVCGIVRSIIKFVVTLRTISCCCCRVDLVTRECSVDIGCSSTLWEHVFPNHVVASTNPHGLNNISRSHESFFCNIPWDSLLTPPRVGLIKKRTQFVIFQFGRCFSVDHWLSITWD